MEYQIEVIQESGKNYFVANCDNSSFLFQRLHAESFIAHTYDSPITDKFYVIRNGSIIMAGFCYNLLRKHPIYWIEYSEHTTYTERSSWSSPWSILFADDFKPGDLIVSETNVGENKAKGYLSLMKLMNFIETSFNSFKSHLKKSGVNVSGTTSISARDIQRLHTTADVIDIKTYIVPAYL